MWVLGEPLINTCPWQNNYTLQDKTWCFGYTCQKGMFGLPWQKGYWKYPAAQVSQEKPPNPVRHLHCPVLPSQSLPSTPAPWHWHAEEHICKENICSIMILKLLLPLEAKGWHLSWSTGSKCQRNYVTYADTGGQNTLVCSLLLVKTGKEKKKTKLVHLITEFLVILQRKTDQHLVSITLEQKYPICMSLTCKSHLKNSL